MKKFRPWAMLAAIVVSLGYLISLAAAQQPARPAAGPSVALLDVSFIFKNHARFKSRMEEMKADVDRAQNQVKTERETMEKLVERLQEFRKGTPEYKQMEEDLVKRRADLAVQVELAKNQFLQREAATYNDVYREILQVTDYYCKQRGIEMVLRFNGDQVDPDRPDSVLSFINRPVVWHQDQMDITPFILQELNRSAPNPAQANRPAQPARPTVPFNR